MRLYLYLFVIFSFLLLAGCSGGPPPDFQSMLLHMQNSYPNVWRLITATAYVLGFFFAFRAVYTLKIYGEMRTMMSSNASLKGPIVYLLVAAALIFSPTVFHTFMISTFGQPDVTPLSYAGHIKGWSKDATIALLGLVQIVGLIAFVRGWLYLARTAEGSGQPGNFGKGMTHIFGGLLAINIMGTWDVIKSTFGWG